MASDKDLAMHKTAIVADDHAIVRQVTAQILEQIPRLLIVAEAANGLEAMAAVRTHKPDLLVLDAAMPYAKGIEVFTEARRWSPDTSIAVLTGFTSANLLAEWIDVGANGILLKSCEPDEIRRGLEAVLAGHNFVAEEVRAILKDSNYRVELTPREREVLSLVGSGYSSAAIADRLCISIKTVEKHRGSLMAKLGVATVAQLLAHALKEGLLETHKQL